jgi:hypothetical protein
VSFFALQSGDDVGLQSVKQLLDYETQKNISLALFSPKNVKDLLLTEQRHSW